MATHQPPLGAGGWGLGAGVPQAVSVSSLPAHLSLSTPAGSLGNPDSGHEGNGSSRPRPSQCWVPGCRADVLKGRLPKGRRPEVRGWGIVTTLAATWGLWRMRRAQASRAKRSKRFGVGGPQLTLPFNLKPIALI